MGAALNNAGCGNEGQLGFLLKLFDGQCAAVAHGGLDLAQRAVNVVL